MAVLPAWVGANARHAGDADFPQPFVGRHALSEAKKVETAGMVRAPRWRALGTAPPTGLDGTAPWRASTVSATAAGFQGWGGLVLGRDELADGLCGGVDIGPAPVE